MGNLVQRLAQAYYNGTWGLWTGWRVPTCRLLITGKSVWPLGHAASLQDGPDPRARDHNRSPCIDLQTFGVVSVASCPYVTHTNTHTHIHTYTLNIVQAICWALIRRFVYHDWVHTNKLVQNNLSVCLISFYQQTMAPKTGHCIITEATMYKLHFSHENEHFC